MIQRSTDATRSGGLAAAAAGAAVGVGSPARLAWDFDVDMKGPILAATLRF
jgi:hypothetical protein